MNKRHNHADTFREEDGNTVPMAGRTRMKLRSATQKCGWTLFACLVLFFLLHNSAFVIPSMRNTIAKRASTPREATNVGKRFELLKQQLRLPPKKRKSEPFFEVQNIVNSHHLGEDWFRVKDLQICSPPHFLQQENDTVEPLLLPSIGLSNIVYGTSQPTWELLRHEFEAAKSRYSNSSNCTTDHAVLYVVNAPSLEDKEKSYQAAKQSDFFLVHCFESLLLPLLENLEAVGASYGRVVILQNAETAAKRTPFVENCWMLVQKLLATEGKRRKAVDGRSTLSTVGYSISDRVLFGKRNETELGSGIEAIIGVAASKTRLVLSPPFAASTTSTSIAAPFLFPSFHRANKLKIWASSFDTLARSMCPQPSRQKIDRGVLNVGLLLPSHHFLEGSEISNFGSGPPQFVNDIFQQTLGRRCKVQLAPKLLREAMTFEAAFEKKSKANQKRRWELLFGSKDHKNIKNFTEIYDDLLDAASTRAPFCAWAKFFREQHVVVAVYHQVLALSCLFLPPSAVVVVLAPRGVSYEEQVRLERLLRNCNSATVLWDRAEEDSRIASVPGGLEMWFTLPEKEVKELAIEVLLLLRSRFDLQSVDPTPPPTFPQDLNTVVLWSQRNLYDPDFFALRMENGWRLMLPASKKNVLKCILFCGAEEAALVLNETERNRENVQPYELSQLFFNASDQQHNFTQAVIEGLDPNAIGNKFKKKVKYAKVVGNTSLIRFGYHIENRDFFVDAEVSIFESKKAAANITGDCRTHLLGNPAGSFVYVHYPWVRDNVYHQHNDNIFPLLVAIARNEGKQALYSPLDRTRTLLLLPTQRSEEPLPMFEPLLKLFFTDIRWVDQRQKDESVCVEGAGSMTLVWGRPKRVFAAESEAVMEYADTKVISVLRAAVWNWSSVVTPKKEKRSASDKVLRVTWISRRHKRVLVNEGVLVGLLQIADNRSARINVSICCDGMPYQEQVRLMAQTDILVGVHGAGLLHIVHLNPDISPLVVHVASRRLNYHEQTILERLALLAGVRYMTTRTKTPFDDATASWQLDFSLPHGEMRLIVEEMLLRYDSLT